MKKIIYSIIIALSFTAGINALPSVAICGFDASGGTSTAGDEFSFVLLRDFAAGEVLYFTEDEYSLTTSAFFFGEGHLEYTVPAGGLLENDVVRILETGANIFTVQCASGTAVHIGASGTWSYSGSDELYAYSASNPSSPWNSVTEIHCFYYGSVIAPTPDQNPTPDWPNTIKLNINLGDGAPSNTDFLDASRINTTIPDLQNGANWLKSSGSGITLSCTDFTNQMLPIDLVSFKARLKGNEVLLDWITASEINNERFEIEHSTDNQLFFPIGSQTGIGTSFEKNEYHMVHHFPVAGINYYRLKQIDFDGKYDYSDVVFIRLDLDSEISIYPNPTKEQFIIKSNNSLAEGQQFLIYDAMGRQVTVSSNKESENILRFNASTLEAGIYYIKLSSGNMRKVIKL